MNLRPYTAPPPPYLNFLQAGVSFNLAPEAAVALFKAKGLQPTFAWDEMLGEEHARAFTIAKMMDVDLLRDTRELVDQAIGEGRTLAWFKEQLTPHLQAKGWWGRQEVVSPEGNLVKAQLGSPARLETIFRTNMQTSYAAGQWDQITAQADALPYLMYDAIDDWRTRPEHAALDNTVLPVTDPFWEKHYPPNGWNCRCGVIQMDQAMVDAAGLTVASKAPDVGSYNWKDPTTGKTHKIPGDLDPGWDYNPGKAYTSHLSKILGEKIATLPPDMAAAAQAGLEATAAAADKAQVMEAAIKANKELAKAEGKAQLAARLAKTKERAALFNAEQALKDIAEKNPPHLGSALKQAAKSKSWEAMSAVERLALVQAKAAKIEESAHLAHYKQALAKGKKPPAAAQAVFDAQSEEVQASITADVKAKTAQVYAQDQIDTILAQPQTHGLLGDEVAALKAAQPTLSATELLSQASANATTKANAALKHIAENPAGQTLKAKALKAMLAAGETNAPPWVVLKKVEQQAAQAQAKASHAAKLTGYKKKVLAGKVPSPSEQAAFDALQDGQKTAFVDKLDAEKLKAAQTHAVGAPDVADLVPPASFPEDMSANYPKSKAGAQQWLHDQELRDADGFLDENGTHILSPFPKADMPPMELHALANQALDTGDIKLYKLAQLDPALIATANPVLSKSGIENAVIEMAKKQPEKFGARLLCDGKQVVIYDGNFDAAAAHLLGKEMKVQVLIPKGVKAPIPEALFKKPPSAPSAPSAAPSVTPAVLSAKDGAMLLHIKESMPPRDVINGEGDPFDWLMTQGEKSQLAKQPSEADKWLSELFDNPDELTAMDPGAVAADFTNMLKDQQASILAKAASKAESAPAKAAKQAAKPSVAPQVEPVVVSAPSPTPDPANFTQIGPQKGSNPGGLFQDTTTGKQYYVKWIADDAARNEVLASKLYQAAGVDVPDLYLIDKAGKPGVASTWVEGLTQNKAALTGGKVSAGVNDAFVVDAWLGNWDVAGASFDNLLVKAGKATRIDVGGALRYRAQGGIKGEAWGAKVEELESLRNPNTNPNTAALFKHVTEADLEAGVARVLAVTEENITALVDAYGPTAAAERAKLVKTLLARQADLAERFPGAAKRIPAATPSARVSAQDLTQIKASRLNGYAIRTDRDMIEDQQVLIWQEKGEAGATNTVAKLKVRGAGETAIKRLLEGSGDASSLNKQHTDSSMTTAIRGIASRAAKGEKIRTTDIDRVKAARGYFSRAYEELSAGVKAGDYAKETLQQFAGYYEPWLRAMEEAVKPGANKAYKWTATSKERFVGFNPKRITKPSTKPIALTAQEGSFVEKVIEKGRATQTDRSIYQAHFYEGEVEGVRVRYWGEEAPFALQNTVELSTEGADLASVQRALATLEKLGVNATTPTALDAEELYLTQTAYHIGGDTWRALRYVYELKDQATRIAELRKSLSEALGVKSIEKLPGYNPQGVRGAFDHGKINFYRPDLEATPAAKREWAAFQEGYRLHHSNSTNGSITATVDKVLNSGGMFTPSTDKLRRGIPLGGMSQGSDLGTGGGSYFFTRIQTTKDAYNAQGFVWKSRKLARLDSISYNHDAYGRTQGDFVLDNRRSGVSGWKSAAVGGNETIFKDGLSIFDDLEAIVANNNPERDGIIASFKRHGYTQWPDGRSLEEVIVVKGTRK